MFGRGKMETRIEQLEHECDEHDYEISRANDCLAALQKKVFELEEQVRRLAPQPYGLSAGNPYHPSMN